MKPFLARDATRLYPNGDFVFHQDAAPAHVSKVTTAFMAGKMKFLTKTETLPKSPDTDPMNYFVWGWMKKRLQRIEVKDMAQLKKAVKRVWRQLPQEMINNALAAWPRRVHSVYKASGKHIEKFK